MMTLPPSIQWTGARIRALRKHVRENQTEFAQRLGYSSGAARISDFEREVAELPGTIERLLDLWADRVGWTPTDADPDSSGAS